MQLVSFRILCILLAGVLLGAPASTGLSLAQGNARVVFSPSAASVGEGATTAVEVRVEDVQNLYGLDIRVSFDPSVVEVLDADPGKDGIQVRPGDMLSVDFMVRNTADNTQGTIWYALTQVNPSQPVSGSGTVIIIFFKGKQRGSTSPLTITGQQLAAPGGAAIAASALNGEVRVLEASQSPPTPTTAPPAPQPTIPMPTPEPTQVPPTARPTLQPTAPPTVGPSATQPAAAPTGKLPATAVVATDTRIPTATKVATQALPATGTPAPVPSATVAATAAAPTQPARTASPAAPTLQPHESQGGLILGEVMMGFGVVVALGALGVGAWALRRRGRLAR